METKMWQSISKNTTIILTSIILVLLILFFSNLDEDATLLKKSEAMALVKSPTLSNIVVKEPYLYFEVDEKPYKIAKDAYSNEEIFSLGVVTYHEDVSEEIDKIIFVLLFVSIVYLIYSTRNARKKEEVILREENNKDKVQNEHIQPQHSSVNFSDVAGVEGVKEELKEIIDFLKNPEKYNEFDISLPKGVLLVGPPGVGKTLIAKAVAGEANVPFFYQSAASFVQIYVGMGAKRVSELFQKAKDTAPSIVFIDEIDAVGKSRGEFRNDEREATLNQLLIEMDGFEDSAGVIVIGATNKIDMLDEALLRAGRFDRQIHIPLPDLADRIKILEHYLVLKPNLVNIKEVAQMTVGFSAAALDTLTNEAALHAMRAKGPMIETSDFEAVKDKVLLGKRKIRPLSQEEREIQAVYQGAKALVATWLDVEFDKITILNTQLIIREQEIVSKSQLLARIKVYLAGSLAMQKRYKEQFSNGATDIFKAKELISKILYEYSMVDNFVITPKQEEILLREAVVEVNKLLETLDTALDEVMAHILNRESITSDECRDILRKIF
jgi:ATP-dependent metalloprotease FtsH